MGLFLKRVTASWSLSVRGMVSQRRSWAECHKKERIPFPTCTEVDIYSVGGEKQAVLGLARQESTT